VEKLKEALREEIEKLKKDSTSKEEGTTLVEHRKISPGWRQGKIPEGPQSRQRPPMGEDREAEKASTCPTGTTR
jgi:hypothetical protein